ncbi:type II toxin-antitoxin system RelE/ParE family toxin [Methylobacter sp.]|uniref:type II toxin-antitoxin system RelE/ParE family toxin n=1 Tax=Methylobacter sp. TaxID=2051955 RepID=UPI00122C0646|nr:MAG: type II toxin-antitoxin system RelE/ParE family toxin [Methylobacter sp.]
MSGGELSLILSPQAEDDFADILQYTLESWGENQVYIYRTVLDKALRTIQQNPEIGHRKKKISSEHRCFPAGKHIIIYRIVPNAILVSRILHERMDYDRNF